jgi:hypothetical protein
MASESAPLLQVGLNSWIIADGNYADFTVGEVRPFALEFYNEVDLRPLPKSQAGCAYKSLGRAHYAVKGRTVHLTPKWAVIDVGFLAYREFHSFPPPPRRFESEIWVGVDPFFYFETLSLEREAPPLVFDWRIHRIEVETAPRVLQANMWVYDPDRLCLKDVEDTREGEDFVLHCELVSAEPRHRLATV